MVQLIPKPASNDVTSHLDPLACAIAPAKDETAEQRIARLKAEEQAKKLSDDIDKFLKKSAASGDVMDGHRKKAMAVKVLLLGQSECGKSTALKNFQLLYNPQSFQAERAAWRMVILFNLVQSIRVLHTIISDAMQAQQQLQEEAEQFGKSPTSPIFGGGRLSHGVNVDFQDLFPQQQQRGQQQIHRKRSSGPELTNGNAGAGVGVGHASIAPQHSDHDQTDAASTYSAATSSSSNKNIHPRRSSFFASSNSKEGKGHKEVKESKEKKSRSRPATSNNTTGPLATAPSSPISLATPTMTNAFCLPTQTFGPLRPSPPSTQSQAQGRRVGSGEVKIVSLHGSRPTTATATATTIPNGNSPTSPRKSPQLSLSIPLSTPETNSSSRSPVRHYPISSSSPTTTTAIATSPPSTTLHTAMSSSSRSTSSHPPGLGEFTAQHQLLLMRLKPLLTVELALLRRLSLPDDVFEEPSNEEEVVEGEGGVIFTGKQLNPEGGYEVPVMMTANAARGGPITSSRSTNTNINPNLNPNDNIIRPRSLHDKPEREAVKLDFNLAGKHAAAVNAAKEGMIEFSTPSFSSLSSKRAHTNTSKHNNKHISKTVSNPGRPRARSSVDIGGIEGSMGRPSLLSPPPSHGTITTAMKEGVGSGSGPWPPVPSSSATHTLGTMNMTRHPNGSTGGNVGYTAAAIPPGGITTPGFTIHPSTSTSSLDLERYNSRTNASDPIVPMPEFFVRSTTNWKEKLRKWKRYNPGVKIGLAGSGGGGGGGADGGGRAKSSDWNPWDEDEDPAHLIQACSRDVMGLWNDPAVKEYLTRNRYKLEHLPGFFLSDVDRIVSRDYTPTDDDILRARLKTIGAVEHKFCIDTRGSVPRDWLVYDVGGARTQRAAWVPFFDAVDAIIFIVSLSSFDQSLSEDPSINRMEDSLRSFRDLVGSKILKNVNIILFLNKVDLLESKLNSGVQLARYFKRYGDRPNTTEAVTKYFRAKFTAIYDKYTPPHAKRVFGIHATSLTNPQSTRIILEAVNESIIQMHIAKSVS